MNISAFKSRVKPRLEPSAAYPPIEESEAMELYKTEQGKTDFFRKLEDLCTTIYEYEDFQRYKFYKGELPAPEPNRDLDKVHSKTLSPAAIGH